MKIDTEIDEFNIVENIYHDNVRTLAILVLFRVFR